VIIVQVRNHWSVAGSFHPSHRPAKANGPIILHPNREANLGAANRTPFVKAISRKLGFSRADDGEQDRRARRSHYAEDGAAEHARPAFRALVQSQMIQLAFTTGQSGFASKRLNQKRRPFCQLFFRTLLGQEWLSSYHRAECERTPSHVDRCCERGRGVRATFSSQWEGWPPCGLKLKGAPISGNGLQGELAAPINAPVRKARLRTWLPHRAS
jgi:hypothetical protein